MKLFLVLLFIGCASATLNNAFQEASEEIVQSFLEGMAQAPPLHLALGREETPEMKRIERDVQEELKVYLREAFEKIIRKIQSAIESGKDVNEDAFQKLRELRDKMHQLKIQDHEIDEFKSKLNDHLFQILDKMGLLDKRSVDDSSDNILTDLNFRNFFLRLKKMILEKMDVSTLKASLAKVVGQTSSKFCEWLTNKGKEKLLNFFDRVLEFDDEGMNKRSISDFYEEIKDYFKDLDMDFKNDFHKFAEWVRTSIEKGLEKTKNKIEVIKKMAEELLNKAKSSSKDVTVETFCMMKEHRSQLGGLYEEVRDKVMERLARPDKRSISDFFKEVKDYFQGLDMDFKDDFHKFGDWVKTNIAKGLEKTKDKVEVLKKMAEELLNKAKGSGKDVAVDSFCMMKEHRADLGGLYEEVRNRVIEKLLRM